MIKVQLFNQVFGTDTNCEEHVTNALVQLEFQLLLKHPTHMYIQCHKNLYGKEAPKNLAKDSYDLLRGITQNFNNPEPTLTSRTVKVIEFFQDNPEEYAIFHSHESKRETKLEFRANQIRNANKYFAERVLNPQAYEVIFNYFNEGKEVKEFTVNFCGAPVELYINMYEYSAIVIGNLNCRRLADKSFTRSQKDELHHFVLRNVKGSLVTGMQGVDSLTIKETKTLVTNLKDAILRNEQYDLKLIQVYGTLYHEVIYNKVEHVLLLTELIRLYRVIKVRQILKV